MCKLLQVITSLSIIILISSCAKVPQQAVDLSATVGKDLVTVYQSHKATANLLFSRMKDDVNDFVDNVYAPYQIGKLLEQDYADFTSGDPESLVSFIHTAANNSSDAQGKKRALEAMNFFVTYVQSDIEGYRKELLAPINKQEKEVLQAIDKSYNQIIYAHSIVTAHIASVRKVHESQEEILNLFGIEDLRSKSADKLNAASEKLSELLDKVDQSDIQNAEAKFKEVKDKINEVLNQN
ncbi:hypothetical protein [Fulvivirga lutea]|uniref:Lipoprotein n=1 Tax=Fulvivirga lutea TaxID=2810512 RepID=A0A974WHI7_9BACT|nr:hypothetical protein [Fulvivirga lutea]QSE98654.1 hypothetical protein JR347_06130 [Fulvivirga lutea]